MEFRLLGPLEARADGEPLPLGGAKQRALLARLLLEPNRTVPVQQLVDDLWGDEVPPTAVKMVHVFVSQLRKVIPRDVLRTSPPGYALHTRADDVDVARFARLRREGRAAASAGDPAAASERFGQALELWHGPALADIGEEFARAEAAHLEETRLVCIEERIEADLALGRHADLVGELEALVARRPERGRLQAQLMLALYRAGRHGDALASYRTYRRRLDDELGLAPSSELRELEQRIVVQDPSLDRVEPAADEPAPSPPVAARRQDPFVGRDRELARLAGVLEDAAAGSGRIVALAGEPGIGKTRLAGELAAAAAARGVRVVGGRCHEQAGAPPYWPWVQILRGLAPDGGGGDLADLVPELPGAGQHADPRQAQFRLFDAIASHLSATCRSGPVLAILDDAHWADPDSLRLLEFLAGELASTALLLLVTYRDVAVTRGHPLSQTIAELHRAPGFEALSLRGLSEDATRRFVVEIAGDLAPGDVARAVHARTQGNPLFIAEFARLLRQEETLASTELALPAGVRDVIGRRLAVLGPRNNELLQVAALIGGEFDVAELASTVDAAVDESMQCLEQASDAAVIAESPPGSGRFAFTHALFAETLTAQLSHVRRAALHAGIALAIEERGEEVARERAAELARHYAGARPLLGPGPLIRWSLVAGERALAAFAYEDAAAIFERAAAARSGDAMDDDLAQVLFGLCRAQLALRELRDLDEALANLERAFDHYVRTGQDERALQVATHPLPPHLLYDRAGVTRLVERALQLAPGTSTAAGQLLAFLGWLLGINHGDYEAAQAALRRARAIAADAGDAALEVKALVNTTHVELFHLRWQECLDVGRRAIELAVRGDDAHGEMAARGWASRALVVLGRPEEAGAQAATAMASAERLRERYWLATSALHNAIPAAALGRWSVALEHIDRALAARPFDARTTGLRAFVRYQVGDDARGAEDLERLRDLADRVPPPGPGADHPLAAAFLPLCDLVAGSDDHLAAASVIAEKVLALERRTPYLTTCAHVGLGLIAARTGDTAAARTAYAALCDGAAPMLALPTVSLDRVLGELALAAGMTQDAIGHLERALTFCASAGYEPERAWTMLALAVALRRRGAEGDERTAEGLQAGARSAAKALGLRAL